MFKRLCIKCTKSAVWWYVPSDVDGNRYYCDNCVPRGCSCNIKPSTNEEYQDEQGRKMPCCEYDYNERGYMKIESRLITHTVLPLIIMVAIIVFAIWRR